MNATKPFQLGSISTGTLKTEDLLEEFFDTLEILNSHHVLVAGATKARLLMDSRPDSGYGDYLETQQETALELVNELQDALNELCPPFVYFGAHPGDGADFGFLVDWDTIEEDIGHALPNRGEYEFITDTHRFVVVGEYVTCLDLDRNVIWSTL